MRTMRFANVAAFAAAAFLAFAAMPTPAGAEEEVEWDRSVLPIPPKPFEGHVGLREPESVLDFPPCEQPDMHGPR